MEGFICFSKAKENFNCDGESLGPGNDRALYYPKLIGKRRIYRSAYPTTYKSFMLFIYKTSEEAEQLCALINEANNDDFKPLQLIKKSEPTASGN